MTALAVDRHRYTTDGLHNEAVEGSAEDRIVVEAGTQAWIETSRLGFDAIDHTLVEIGCTDAPDATGKHDVVAVVHFAEVVKRAGLLGERQGISAAVVGDSDVALFDIDVGGTVFAHGAELDKVTIGRVFSDGVEQIHGADDVVGLGVDGMTPIDHRVWGAALFAKMHDGVRSEAFEGWLKKGIVAEIAHKQLDVLAGELMPEGDAFVDGWNGDEAIGAEFVIVATADEIIENGDVVAVLRKMDGSGPAEVSVAANHQNPHIVYSFISWGTIAMVKNTMVK